MRYLNIGDPIAFGFKTPPHLIDAVERAMRDGHNNYGPSAGIAAAREAVAAEYTRNGFPIAADRVFITAGTSEGIELTLGAVVDAGGEVLVPMPTYPLYTAVLAKLDAQREVLPARSVARLDAGSRPSQEPGHAGDARARRHRSEQPDRRGLLDRDAPRAARLRRSSTAC